MATTQLITNNYKLLMAQQFINSFTGPSNTMYYAYAGQSVPNNTISTIYDNPQTTEFNAYNTMLFGKHITPNDVTLMINYYPWASGTVYPIYDDADVNLSTKQFYVCVYQNSSYYVFKCLNNNNGAVSTYPPTFSDTAADDVYYQTADGYQWKYMYTCSSGEFKKFSTNIYMPVIPDANVTANAVAGAVDVIVVETPGTGYKNYFSGKFGSNTAFSIVDSHGLVQLANVVYANSSTSVYASTNNVLTPSTTNGVYDQCYLYISGGTAKGSYRRITTHVSNSKGIYLYLESTFPVTPDSTSNFDISPSVVILNSGDDDPGVEARAIINAASSNSVSSIQVLSRGSNVFFANAFIYATPQVGVTSNASVRVITGPVGGHGSNVAAELYCSRVGVSVTFSNSEVGTIPTVGSYGSAGIIKNPMFANVVFTISTLNGTFSAGDTIKQTTTDAVSNLSTTATAVVTKVNVGSLQVTNVSGIFSTTSNATYGTVIKSDATANAWITAIENNGVVKQFSTFTQYYRYAGSYISGQFTSSEPVYQQTIDTQYLSGYETSSAVFYANNVSGNTVYLSKKFGPIKATSDLTGFLTGSSSGSTFDINTVIPPDLVQESGDVLYIENFPTVNRSSTQSETVKLILEY